MTDIAALRAQLEALVASGPREFVWVVPQGEREACRALAAEYVPRGLRATTLLEPASNLAPALAAVLRATRATVVVAPGTTLPARAVATIEAHRERLAAREQQDTL